MNHKAVFTAVSGVSVGVKWESNRAAADSEGTIRFSSTPPMLTADELGFSVNLRLYEGTYEIPYLHDRALYPPPEINLVRAAPFFDPTVPSTFLIV